VKVGLKDCGEEVKVKHRSGWKDSRCSPARWSRRLTLHSLVNTNAGLARSRRDDKRELTGPRLVEE